VVEAVTQPTGFSPGLAARLRLADGRRAFVKAVGPEPNPDSPGFHRTEARIMAALPRSAPAPRLLWSLDQGGWVALAFEDVDGVHPSLPWQADELGRVLAMLTDMARTLTPAPAGMRRIGDRLQEAFKGWRRLAAAHADAAGELASLDPWAVRHLDRLAELEAGWPRATSTGCAAGPAGADRPRALEEGPAQLLQPGCRPLGACRKLAEPIEPPPPHEPLTFPRRSGISG
jgi:hypothetical protein